MKINKKISSFLITTILFLSITGLVIAKANRFTDFDGEGHGGCHGPITESASGYISLSSSSGSSVSPSETFTITIQIFSFSEESSTIVLIGFPIGNPGRGNNKDFSFNTTQEHISIDSSGNSATLDFQVTAPATEQTYTLHADALRESNYFAHGDFIVTVEVQNNPPQFSNIVESSDPLEFGQEETFQVDVTDSETNVDTVNIELEGTNYSMTNTVGDTFEYNWTPSTIGLKNYIFYANDTNGSMNSTSGNINVIDTTLPNLTNLLESADPLELGQTETIQINVTDLSGVSHVLIEFSGVNHTMSKISSATWEYNSWTPTSTGLKSYTIYANDTEDLWNSINNDITVIDTITPTFSDLIESADPLPLGQNETINIKVYDTPGSGVNEVILEYDSINHTMIFTGGNTWTWSNWKPSSIGTFNYIIYMTDNSNNLNTTSGSIDVFISSGPIIQNISKSADPLEFGELETVQVDVNDTDGISDVFIEIGGTNYTMANIGGIKYEYAWLPSSIGTKLFTIHANDSLNNWSQLSNNIFVQDTTPPNYANIVENSDPLELGNALTISIDATDLSGINQIKFEIDGVNITMYHVGGNTWSNNTWLPSSTGVKGYTIWVNDNNGNWNSTSSDITVQDTTTPLWNNLIESDDPLELGDNETITITATDASGINVVYLEYGGVNNSMNIIGGDQYQWTNWQPISVGVKPYTIYINDNTGFWNETSGDITVQDTITPIWSDLIESADLLELGNNETITITVTDSSGINVVYLEYGGVNYTMNDIGGDQYNWTNWQPSTTGVKSYTIYMNDNTGFWNETSGDITVTDTSGPTLFNIVKSSDSIFLGQSVSIQVDVIDLSGVTDVIIELENSNHTMALESGNTWEINNLTPGTIGSLSFTIYANDLLGNWNVITDTIMVNMPGGDGNDGMAEENFELIVVYGTLGIIGVLAIVLVNSLRPKRFIK